MPKTIAYDTHFDYGVGVDSSAEQVRGTAVARTQPATVAGAAGAEVTYSTHLVQSQTQLEDALGVSAAMSLNYGFVAGGSAKVDFAQSHSMDDYSLCVVVKATVKDPVLQMSGIKLTPEAKDLYARNPDDFKARYGDMYVNGVLTGGELFGIIMMHAKSTSDKQSLNTSLNASGHFGLWGADLSVDVKSSVSEATKNTDCSVFVSTSGYTPDRYPQTVDDLLNLASEFPGKVVNTGRATPYAVDLMDYKFLDLPAGPNPSDIQNRDDVIRYAAEIKAQAVTKRASIEFIRGNPHLFPTFDQKQLADWEGQLNALLDRIHQKVSNCFNDWRNCAFGRDDLVLPAMELPEAVTPQDTPIAAKYKLTGGPKGFLGPVQSDEMPCMDGRGKCQRFASGAIFWHPSTGAFEVHGTIYQKYSELRCEQGALGYPISDEKSQANSVDRYSTFQHGVINWTAATNVAKETIAPRLAFRPILFREGAGLTTAFQK